MGICEVIYVEEDGQCFPPSVLRFPVMQHEQQFEKIWLAGSLLEEALVTLGSSQNTEGGWDLAKNN